MSAESSPASVEAPPVPVSPEPPAVSEARLRANRANAQKSTGPRTPEGKARSSQNALVHGLRAASILVPGEDPRELITYRISMIRSTNPRNPIEMEYVEQVIRAGWKLRRYQAAEVFVLECKNRDLKRPGQKRSPTSGWLLTCELWDHKQFQALPRYELQYTRMMNRALDELRKLKKDPIYEIQDDFAGEMIATEEEHLRELESTPSTKTQPQPEIAPNEPSAAEPKLSDDLADAYDPVLEELCAMTDPAEVLAMCKRRFANEPEPLEASS